MAEPNYGLLNTNMPAEAALAPIRGASAVNTLQAQQLQNDADQMEIRNALAEQEAYKQAAQGQGSVSQNLLGAGLGGKAAAYQKSTAEAQKLGTEGQLKKLELERERFSDLRFNPSDQNVIAHLQDSILRNETTPEKVQGLWQQISSMNPDQRKQYFTEMGTKADTVYKNMTLSAHDREQLNISRGNLAVAQGHLALAKQDQALKQAEKGPLGQELKDIQANTKALKTAGYDPETGVDKVSDLIKQSTSGMGQAAAAGILGALGYTTSGKKAIGQLDTISKTMTLDLLNNKLGAGISNADRDALEARFGSIADANLPAEQRLAAWTEAKEIMRKAAMLPKPKGVGKSAAGGVDTSNPLLK